MGRGNGSLPVALAIGTVLNLDPKGTVRIVNGLRIAVFPTFVLIFLLDCITPLGIAVPVLYAVPVLMSSLTVDHEWAFGAGLLATALTYLGYSYSPPGGNADEGTINRLIASVLIWACVLFGWFLRYVRQEIQMFYQENKRTN